MIVLNGKSVCGGICFGRISLYKRDTTPVKRRHIDDTSAEISRYNEARKVAIDELELLFHKATHEIGEAEAQIFSIHKMMLEDIDYNESVENIIDRQKLCSEAAVLMTAETFSKMFSEMDDVYMQARASDVLDISDRVIAVLNGRQDNNMSQDSKDLVIFADDLAPSETLQMDKEKISAFVTEKGSTTSHTAILARSLNIPAIIGISGGLKDEYDGKEVAIDGYSGKVYVEPTKEIIAELTEKKREKDEQLELLKSMKDQPSVTLDGKEIKLYANIGTPADLGGVILNDAEGIGLFRSEFLYLQTETYPSEDLQFEAYKKVAESMGEKPVIIRTLDIGADKQISYFKLKREENPALGMRAIRICLTRTDIFKTQLRAILRASAFGNIMIMLPMIVSPEEIKKAKELLNEAKNELRASGIPFFENISVGIMIETPAAVMISDILAEHADFFSIGTNDLVQYMLAMDRQNEDVSEMMNTRHEAVMRAIKMVIDNSHKKGIWTGICGELGSDPELIPKFLEMGIDELSVVPGKVLEIRKIIRESYAEKENRK